MEFMVILTTIIALMLSTVTNLEAKTEWQKEVFTVINKDLAKDVAFVIKISKYSLPFKIKKYSFMSELANAFDDTRPLEFCLEEEKDCETLTGKKLIIPTEEGAVFNLCDVGSVVISYPKIYYSAPKELTSWAIQNIEFPVVFFNGSFMITTSVQKEQQAQGYCYQNGGPDPLNLGGGIRPASGSNKVGFYNKNSLTKIYRVTNDNGIIDICVSDRKENHSTIKKLTN